MINIEQLTPKEIINFLDQYIIGQKQAKKLLAIALRNRWRRQQLADKIKEEITPKNILMIGPTGVGKTEIARRIAKLLSAPFVKVEASKFTEVGYVGRDVETIIRDLVETSINLVKQEKITKIEPQAREQAIHRIVEYFLPGIDEQGAADPEQKKNAKQERDNLKKKFHQKIKDGDFDSKIISIEVKENLSGVEFLPASGDIENLKDTLHSIFSKRKSQKKMSVKDAKKYFYQEEANKLIDKESIYRQAIERVEQSGIVFIDEIDKVISKGEQRKGDISGEGVQRDLLPIVEGSSVRTKYGVVNTDFILFIAAGAFHFAKPSDMIPEFQGRFPIRVELNSLTKEDLARILKEPANSLIMQSIALLKTEQLTLKFDNKAIEKIADIAYRVNEKTINIGARRLHTVLEKLLEDVSFSAPEMKGNVVKITADYVTKQLKEISQNEDLSKYIL
jgi:ATP-dependent HslUV protease ATP-binding subunit HslU